MSPIKRVRGARIGGLFVGSAKGRAKAAVSRIILTLDGIEGDAHSGRILKAGARQPAFRRGTTDVNTRQLSLVSVEELQAMAARLGVNHIDPGWLAANVATEGFETDNAPPPGTIPQIGQRPSNPIIALFKSRASLSQTNRRTSKRLIQPTLQP